MYDFVVYNKFRNLVFKVVNLSYYRASRFYFKLQHSKKLQLVATDYIYEG